MKKMWLGLVCCVVALGGFLVWSNSATTANAESASVNRAEVAAAQTDYRDGKQFNTLNRNATDEPQVLIFFSFFCPHCNDFESVYGINDELKKQLPPNGSFVKYHVDFMGGELGSNLTQAWAVAMTLGVQDKVSPPLFNGIQKTQSIRTLDDIRQVFIQAGVSGEEFDSAWNSFIVKSLTAQQRKLAEDVNLRSVPSVLVNGKYMVKNDGLEAKTIDGFVAEFGQVVHYLLNKS